MESLTKEELITDIKHLISVDGTSIDINPNYLEYFEFDELIEIKDQLEFKKDKNSSISNDYLDELYEKCK
jgi:hypothetical protein